MTQPPPTPPWPTIAHHPETNKLTITWAHNPKPEPTYTSVTAQRRGQCEQCTERSLWTTTGPLLCAYHTTLAAYTALPLWRRTLTQKPRP